MSDKERKRKSLLDMAKSGNITLSKAASLCDLSYRQLLRIYKRYLAEGDAGLIHRGRGRQSNRTNPHQNEIIALYQEKYEGFGPTLAAEYLAEEGFVVDHETLRRWLLEKGLWKKQRKRSPYRSSRQRKAQFGELVQIDGSIHDWFEEGKHTCLLNMVDDATGISLAKMDSGETTKIIFICLWQWINKYGIPLALYVDLKSVYVSSKKEGLSHLQQACKKLNIRIIKARSAQAKGRVERKHAVYQDRFIKKMRLLNIKTLGAANKLLEESFLDDINKKFAVKPDNPLTAHREDIDVDLNQVFCWEYSRTLQNDWTFRFKKTTYQIKKKYGSLVKPRAKVTIRKHLNGSLTVWFKNEKLGFIKIGKEKPKLNIVEPKVNKSSKKKAANSTWGLANSYFFK